jgi:hypothetical protein
VLLSSSSIGGYRLLSAAIGGYRLPGVGKIDYRYRIEKIDLICQQKQEK